jgi:hypothetical protein
MRFLPANSEEIPLPETRHFRILLGACDEWPGCGIKYGQSAT